MMGTKALKMKKLTYKFPDTSCVNCRMVFENKETEGTNHIIRSINGLPGLEANAGEEMFIKSDVPILEAILRVFEGFLACNNSTLDPKSSVWMCFKCADFFSELTYFYDKFFSVSSTSSYLTKLISGQVQNKSSNGKPKHARTSEKKPVLQPTEAVEQQFEIFTTKSGRQCKRRKLDESYFDDEPETEISPKLHPSPSTVDQGTIECTDMDTAYIKHEPLSPNPEEDSSQIFSEYNTPVETDFNLNNEENQLLKFDDSDANGLMEEYDVANYCLAAFDDKGTGVDELIGDDLESKDIFNLKANLVCRFCAKEFSSKPARSKHIIEEHSYSEDGKLACKLCDKTFKTLTNFHRHGIKHSGIRIYQCRGCDASFTRSDLLKDHELEFHLSPDNSSDMASLECPGCLVIFKTRDEFQDHRLSNTCRPFKCWTCGKCYSSEQKRSKHMQILHSSSILRRRTTKPVGAQVMAYFCEFCEEPFPRKKYLTKHVLEAHATKKDDMYICNLCNVEFVCVRNIRRHAYTHYQGTGHKCEVCQVSFRKPKNFKIHINSSLHLYNIGNNKTPAVREDATIVSPEENVCPFCDEKFETSVCRNSHMRENHCEVTEDKKYVCKLCNKACENLSKLRRHALRHSSKRGYGCSLCPSSFKHHDDLLKHIRRLHPLQSEKSRRTARTICTECDTKLTSKVSFIKHIFGLHISRSNEGEFYCEICHTYLQGRAASIRHFNLNHAKEDSHSTIKTTLAAQIVCAKCGERFKNPDLLKLHRKDKNCKPGYFPCDFCPKSFYMYISRERHIIFYHKQQEIDSLPYARTKKVYPCGMCDKICSSEKMLERHYSSHSDLRPYACGPCNKSFKVKSYLNDHQRSKAHVLRMQELGEDASVLEMDKIECAKCGLKCDNKAVHFEHICKVHPEERPFPCDFCWRRYTVRSKAHRHKEKCLLGTQGKVGKKERRKEYKCNQCDKVFNRRDALDDHMNFHVTATPYLCCECGASFSYRQSYHRHLRDMHTGNKSFTCEQCGKTFRRKTNLTQHLQSKLHNGQGTGYLSKKRKVKKDDDILQDNDLKHVLELPIGVNKPILEEVKVAVEMVDSVDDAIGGVIIEPCHNIPEAYLSHETIYQVQTDDTDKSNPTTVYATQNPQFFQFMGDHIPVETVIDIESAQESPTSDHIIPVSVAAPTRPVIQATPITVFTTVAEPLASAIPRPPEPL